MKPICLAILFTVILTACTTNAPEPVAPQTPSYSVMTHREDDVVAVQSEPGRVTFDIESPTGISSVVVGADSGSFPPEVVLNLHLSGLENLTVMYGNVTVQASVSSTTPNEISQTTQIGLEEPQSIGGESPYWLDITLAGTESLTIPLQDGYIGVVLTQDFTAGAYEAFSAEWVDFYR